MTTILDLLMSSANPVPSGTGAGAAAGSPLPGPALADLLGIVFGLYGDASINPAFGPVGFRSNTDYRSPYSYGLVGQGPDWFYGAQRQAPRGALPAPIKKPKVPKTHKKSPTDEAAERWAAEVASRYNMDTGAMRPVSEWNSTKEAEANRPLTPVKSEIDIARDRFGFDLPEGLDPRQPYNRAHYAWENLRQQIAQAASLDKTGAPTLEEFLTEWKGNPEGLLRAIDYYGIPGATGSMVDTWDSARKHIRDTAGGFKPGEELDPWRSLGDMAGTLGLKTGDTNYAPFYWNMLTGEVVNDPTRDLSKALGMDAFDLAGVPEEIRRYIETGAFDTGKYKSARDLAATIQGGDFYDDLTRLRAAVANGGIDALKPTSVGFSERKVDPGLFASVRDAGQQAQWEKDIWKQLEALPQSQRQAFFDQNILPYWQETQRLNATPIVEDWTGKVLNPGWTPALNEWHRKPEDLGMTGQATGYGNYRLPYDQGILASEDALRAAGLDPSLYAQPWFHAWLQSSKYGPGIERYVNQQSGATPQQYTGTSSFIQHPLLGRVTTQQAEDFDRFLMSSGGAYLSAEGAMNGGDYRLAGRELFNSAPAYQYFLNTVTPGTYGATGAQWQYQPGKRSDNVFNTQYDAKGNMLYHGADLFGPPALGEGDFQIYGQPNLSILGRLGFGGYTSAPPPQSGFSTPPAQPNTQTPQASAPNPADWTDFLSQFGYADGGLVGHQGEDDMFGRNQFMGGQGPSAPGQMGGIDPALMARIRQMLMQSQQKPPLMPGRGMNPLEQRMRQGMQGGALPAGMPRMGHRSMGALPPA